MVCAPVRSIIPSLKLGDYLSVQAHKPCSICHRLWKVALDNRLAVVTNFKNLNIFVLNFH